jgi:hypothetical protein
MIDDDNLFLIPRLGVPSETLERAMAELGADEQEPDDEGDLVVWTVADVTVHLFEDAGLQLLQMQLEGPGKEAVAEQIRERVPTYSAEEMPAFFDAIDDPDDEGEMAEALNILAAVAPMTAEPALLQLFRRGFTHPEPLVRERAAFDTMALRWPELRPDLQRLVDEDPDEDVRETAQAALDETFR